MNWTKGLRFLTEVPKARGDSPNSVICHLVANKQLNGVLTCENINYFKLVSTGCRDIFLSKTMISARSISSRHKLLQYPGGHPVWSQEFSIVSTRHHGNAPEQDPILNRDFLVQLWIADRKMRNNRGKRKKTSPVVDPQSDGDMDFRSQASQLIGKWFSNTSAAGEKSYDRVEPVKKQPPPSQTGLLESELPEEALLAPLLARSNLLVTRDIEWANLMLGIEQENRYAVVDVCYPESPVGFIREKSNIIFRQLLRQRRPFFADVTDGLGNELFRVRRPFWWLTSSIYAEVDGKEVGVVHRRWHLWKRIYDLYLGNQQFAVVENPGFWNWTFTLKNINGEVLAQIDRDWRGFGFELFTDAGQYVIRFGHSSSYSKKGPASVIEELEVVRPLTLSERAVTVALAVSLDNDYFSRHGGWAIPFIAATE